MLAGLNMGMRNPILGIGHDNFAASWDQYAIGETYESGQRSGHSTWLIAFAENGLPGLVLLASLYFSTLRRAIPLRAVHPELIVTVIAYGVAMTFLAHTYTIYPYLIFALVLAGARIRAYTLHQLTGERMAA
jgi:O-antigen ligase